MRENSLGPGRQSRTHPSTRAAPASRFAGSSTSLPACGIASASPKPSQGPERFFERFGAARLTLLRQLAKRPHRYRLYRLGTMALTLGGLFLVPLLGVARFDLFSGEHRALGEAVGPLYGFVAVSVAIFSAYFLTFQVNLVAGRMFCGWGCPVGQLNRLSDDLRAARAPRQKLLWGAALLSFVLLLSSSVAMWWSAPAVFLSWPEALLAVFLILSMAGAAIFFGQHFGWSFCRKACPIGLYYSVVQQRRPLSILYEQQHCLDEGACLKACPVLLDPRDMREPRTAIGGFALEGLAANSHCLRCGACVEACDLVTFKKGQVALRFGRPDSIEVRLPASRIASPLAMPATPAMPKLAPIESETQVPLREWLLAHRARNLLWVALSLVTLAAVALVVGVLEGRATVYQPKQTWGEPAEHAARAGYQAQKGPFASGAIEGRVSSEGKPVPNALLLLDHPPAGLPLSLSAERVISFREGFDERIYLVKTNDRIRLENQSPQLHKLIVPEAAGGLPDGFSLAPGKAGRGLSTPPPGVYLLGCAEHPAERAQLVVVDHPYFTWSEADGSFRFDTVPGGSLSAVLWFPDLRPSVSKKLSVSAGQTTHVEY